MAQPYIGEIRMFGGNFAPAGWMFCEGQLLPISENDTLFNLIGTTYGGDGQSTFALPDLRGRLPIHMGNNYVLAQTGGAEEITLTLNQIPAHNHLLLATSDIASTSNPANGFLAGLNTGQKIYSTGAATIQMDNNHIDFKGGSQPHTNFQPYLCVNFIISLYGIYPTQT
jgi:microcystin-dependent protein